LSPAAGAPCVIAVMHKTMISFRMGEN